MLEPGPYASVLKKLAGSAFASIRYVEETVSTNADAANVLGDERFSGHTIVAEYQRRGAGRKGRLWLAPAGTALLCTTILPCTIATEHLWVVPFWVALAVRSALLEFGIATWLQWPNDVLLGERKLAGILCQARVTGPSAKVACGVGINVRHPGADPGIDPPPAFCDDVALVDRPSLLYALLAEYKRRLGTLDDPEKIRLEWEDAAGLPGRPYRISLDGTAESFEAHAVGLAAGGGLRVRRDGGRAEIISLADARVLRS